MINKLTSSALALALTLVIAFPVLAADTANVVVDLKGQKVVKGAGGKEKFESADKARPGDVIEYKAFYRNTGKKTAANVLATIPVPLGTDYIPGSAKPARTLASVDGTDYTPVPLKKKVSLPSGKVEIREVPYEEYRFIRWEVKALEPGKSASFSMRVRISTAAAQTEAPTKK
jgi:uncharacterized repeat protein (TIGR01451 family)